MAEKRNAVFVEFLGLPGSGKSTIAMKLQRILLQKGRSCSNPIYEISRKAFLVRWSYKLYISFISVFIFPRTYLAILENLIRVPKISIVQKYLLLVNIILVIHQYESKHNRNGVILLDQGLYQWMSSLLTRVPTEIRPIVLKTFSYLKNICIPDMVLILELEIAEIHNRLDMRPGKKSLVERKENIIEFLEEYSSVLNSVISFLSTERNCIIPADSESMASEAYSMILQVIENR